MSSKMLMYFFSRKKMVFDENVKQLNLMVKFTVSLQLQMAITDTRRWIRVLSSEPISH